MSLTVALCTHNPEGSRLLRTIDAIVAQLGEVASADLLVVDNASKPSIAEQGLLGSRPVRLIEESAPGLTAARHAATDSAVGDVLLFVDDDNVLSPQYLVTVVKEFGADASLGVLGGAVEAEYDVPPPEWFIREFESWLAIRLRLPEERVETTTTPRSTAFPVGAGFALPRELAAAYFRDAERTARIEGRRGGLLSSGEDVDMALFALSRGFKLVVTGQLHLLHVIPPSRTTRDYLTRLAAANARSCVAIEAKWQDRLPGPIYPALTRSTARMMLAAALTSVLGVVSKRQSIMSAWHRELLRARLRAARGPDCNT